VAPASATKTAVSAMKTDLESQLPILINPPAEDDDKIVSLDLYRAPLPNRTMRTVSKIMMASRTGDWFLM
jgi:hypothetical protein